MTSHKSSDPAPSLLQTFWTSRHLLLQFTLRFIQTLTRGSFLGHLWLIITPLLSLALYSVVFGMIMGGDFNRIENPGPYDYTLGIFLGLALLGLVTETMGSAPHTILSQPNLVNKVVFPVEILPVANFAVNLYRFGINSILFFIGLFLLGPPVRLEALLLYPFTAVLPLMLLALGLAWFLSALGVYFRDSTQLMGFLSIALFYSSAVFYSSHLIPEPILAVLKYNPVLQAIEISRDLFLWDLPVNWKVVLYLYLVGTSSCIIGYFTFKKLKSGFADVL